MTRKLEAIELFEALEAEFSDDELRAKVTLIKSGTSGNNREYPADVLKRASDRGFWNGTKMFLDHPAAAKGLPSKVLNRSVKDMVSAVESTEWVPTTGKEGKVVADVLWFDERFYNFAKRAKDHMGTSVNLLFNGRVEKRQGERFEVVEELAHSKSVDWVAFPAAGGAIEEFIATEGEDDVEWDDVTLDMIKEHRPDLLQATESKEPEPKPEPDPPDPGYITKDDLKVFLTQAHESWENESRQQAAARTQTNQRIVASKLPPKTQSRLMTAFESTGAYDEKAVDEAIESAREELRDAGVRPVVHGLGMSGSEDTGEKQDIRDVAPLHAAMEGAFMGKARKQSSNQEGAN